MLSVLGSQRTACDGRTRREAMRVGGLGLFGGATLNNLLAAATTPPRVLPSNSSAKAHSVILLNLFGGPPHMDMFDLKPDAPDSVRGEFKPISTAVPGLQICELLPLTAAVMDRCTLIRTYSHKYNSHNPYNVLTGFDGGSDRENYFAKRTDHPGIGAVWKYFQNNSIHPSDEIPRNRRSQTLQGGHNIDHPRRFGIGNPEVPDYIVMPAYPGWSQGLRRAGPYGGYLGKQFDPAITICKPQFPSKGEFYVPVIPDGAPRLPALEPVPGLTVDRLDRRRTLLQQIDQQVRQIDRDGSTQAMSRLQRQVFQLLSSPKTRIAFDLSQESDELRDRYGKNLWGNSLLVARRLIEAGSRFVTVNWEEADSGNHWDMHSKNFSMLKVHLPVLDKMCSALVTDLEQRGLLDSTLVVIMGEMGRTPKINKNAGRDHWPQCGFVLLAGAGVKRGFVLGRTDKLAAYPVDRPVSAGDLAATIYDLIGIDPHLTIDDLSGRPIHISHGGSAVKEVYA